MESLLAHIARKERDTLAVKRVDVDERPDLAERFRVAEVPALALVEGQARRREARGPCDRAEDRDDARRARARARSRDRLAR